MQLNKSGNSIGSHKNENNNNALSNLSNREVTTQPVTNPREVKTYMLWTEFFLKTASNYLVHKDMCSLRLTCKAIREAIFMLLPHFMNVYAEKENLLKMIAQMEAPLPFPAILCLKIIITNKDQLLVALLLFNSEKLQAYAPQRRVEAIVMSSTVDFNSITKALPPNIASFECKEGNIAESTTLDLSQRHEFTSVKVGNIFGAIILPPNVQSFECESLQQHLDLDLRSFKNLTTVKIGGISGMLWLPASITCLEVKMIHSSGTLNLRQCVKLDVIKVERIHGNIFLPANVQSFECAHLASKQDLRSFAKLTTVRMGGILDKLQLPATLTDLEVGRIDSLSWGSRKGILDLNQCEKLRAIKIGGIYGDIILPANAQCCDFECGYVNNGVALDLRSFQCLTAVRIGRLFGALQLPATVTSLKVEKIGSTMKGDPKGILDLRECSKLTSIQIKEFDGIVQLPPTIVSFKIEHILLKDIFELKAEIKELNIQHIDVGSMVVLHKYLEKIDVGTVDGKLIISETKELKIKRIGARGVIYLYSSFTLSNTESIEGGIIDRGSSTELDLRESTNLSVLKMDKIQVKLLLSREKNALLYKQFPQHSRIKWCE